jgi:hypothetical protein
MFAAVRLEVKQDQVLAEPGISELELSQVLFRSSVFSCPRVATYVSLLLLNHNFF